MSPRFQRSVGQLLVNGKPRGAGWIVASNYAITAWHCISEVTETDSITLMFDEIQCAVVVVDHDSALDAAILSIYPNGLLPPALPLLARPQDDVQPSPDWYGHGFPGSNGDTTRGITLAGKIISFHSAYNDAPAIQMSCNDGCNTPGFSYASFSGMSGGPVVTNLDGVKAIGIIFVAPPEFGERILFAIPIDIIVQRFSAQLRNIAIASWDNTRRVANIVRDDTDPGLTANIDLGFIEAIWSRGLAGLYCNIRPDESTEFTSALTRVLIHADHVNGTELVISGSASWSAACKKYAREWVPVSGFQADTYAHSYIWRELTSEVQPSDGVHYQNLSRAAGVIHNHCDRWVLNDIRERMSIFFDEPNTVSIINYTIADDILGKMQTLWSNWRTQLETDSVLLHHFLTLMLTAQGNYESSRAGSGAGPKNVDRCIFHPLVFALAVCTCLPEELMLLKHPQPGNIGDDSLPGHACGIEVLKGELLQLAVVKHHWSTPIVLVPHCQTSWAELHANEMHFRQLQGAPEASLDHDPPREVVIARDIALLRAIESGYAALRAHLKVMCNELIIGQQIYAQKSEAI